MLRSKSREFILRKLGTFGILYTMFTAPHERPNPALQVYAYIYLE